MSDEQINNFLDFTYNQCDRKTAEVFIQGNSYDLNKAVEAFYTNPDPQRFKDILNWNESSFVAGRNGAQSQMDALPPYQMDDDGRQSRSLVPLGAPSLPPSRDKSRMSFRSGTDMEMIPYGPYQQGEEIDADMEKALKMSMEDQQIGVIDASGNEYVPDPEVIERERKPGEPAFLKPLPGNNFLPCLVTILHSIPQCREVMLSRYDVGYDYGDNKHWWEGDSIETARVVAVGEEIDSFEHLDLIYEMQRLMSFLGGTDRSYGSAAALSRLKVVQSTESGTTNRDHPLVKFMMAWETASGMARTAYEFDHIFRSVIRENYQSESKNVHLLEITSADLPAHHDFTLYDVLDNCFWQDHSTKQLMAHSFLNEVGPIVVIRLAPRSKVAENAMISIPMTLFADRYLESNEEIVKDMHINMDRGKTVLDNLDDRLGKLELLSDVTSGKASSASKILDSAIAYIEGYGQIDEDDEDEDEDDDDDDDDEDESIDDHKSDEVTVGEEGVVLNATQVLARLQAINKQLQIRLDLLRREKQEVESSLKKLSKLLTDPNEGDGPKPQRTYLLRGVAIATSNQAHITYAMHQSSITPSASAEGPPEVWWRMSYDTAGDKALISKEQVPANSVLSAAAELLSETLLVYACDEMVDSIEEEPLPSPLQEFVALDNATFRHELENNLSSPTVIEGRPIELGGTEDKESITQVDSTVRSAYAPNDLHFAPQANMDWQQRDPSQVPLKSLQPQSDTIKPNLISSPHSDTTAFGTSQARVQEMEEVSKKGGQPSPFGRQYGGMDGTGGDSDTATLGSDGGNDSDTEMSGVLMRSRETRGG